VTNNPGGVITGTNGVAIDTTGSTGAFALSNAGTINGSVNLGNAPNIVTLVSGGNINGNLNLGTNSGSTLVLDGSGQQALSQAVTGFIANSGSLIKQRAGTWIIDQYLMAPVATSVNSGTLTVNQTLDTGALTVAAGAIVNGPGNTSIDAGGKLSNSGSMLSTAGGEVVFLGAGASLTNNVNASIQSTPVNGCGIFGSSAGPAQITNAGNIGGYTGIVLYGGGSITNSGMISGVGYGFL
jgi:fibronectin-binding autotransporter adhesin